MLETKRKREDLVSVDFNSSKQTSEKRRRHGSSIGKNSPTAKEIEEEEQSLQNDKRFIEFLALLFKFFTDNLPGSIDTSKSHCEVKRNLTLIVYFLLREYSHDLRIGTIDLILIRLNLCHRTSCVFWARRLEQSDLNVNILNKYQKNI